jgi:CRP-like cAMP-binding protein
MMVLIRILLAIVLVGSLYTAGRRIYRNLPADDRAPRLSSTETAGATSHLVVRNMIAQATLQSPIEIYRFDLAAARREFEDSPQLAKQFDDFLARRMHDVAPLKVETNRDGIATASLTAGDWWLRARAVLNTGEQIEWRLPVVITNRDQALDLSFENAYERTKQF